MPKKCGTSAPQPFQDMTNLSSNPTTERLQPEEEGREDNMTTAPSETEQETVNSNNNTEQTQDKNPADTVRSRKRTSPTPSSSKKPSSSTAKQTLSSSSSGGSSASSSPASSSTSSSFSTHKPTTSQSTSPITYQSPNHGSTLSKSLTSPNTGGFHLQDILRWRVSRMGDILFSRLSPSLQERISKYIDAASWFGLLCLATWLSPFFFFYCSVYINVYITRFVLSTLSQAITLFIEKPIWLLAVAVAVSVLVVGVPLGVIFFATFAFFWPVTVPITVVSLLAGFRILSNFLVDDDEDEDTATFNSCQHDTSSVLKSPGLRPMGYVGELHSYQNQKKRRYTFDFPDGSSPHN